MRRQRGPEREDGAVAVIVALLVTGLIVVAALVVDIAQARLDRQASKSAADSSVMAGLRAADGGGADVYTKRAVCGALSFLRTNDSALAGLPDGQCAGGWITDMTVCDPDDPVPSTVNYEQTVTSDGVTYAVQIKAPYEVTEGSFPEEGYASLASDTSKHNGCDQVAVIITKTRGLMFGEVVSDQDLTTTIRSVGRVRIDDGDTAPALLLLERTRCNVLQVGSSGSPSRIWVYGNGVTPATVHADTAASEAASCADQNDKRVFQGNQANGIVAYGSTDGDAGLITSYAGTLGVAAGTISDGISNVYGTTALDEHGSGTVTGPAGRSRVGRTPVDEQYRTGVKAALTAAGSAWALDPASPSGWTRVGCTPGAALIAGLTALDKLYIDCPNPSGISLGTQAAPLVINAGEVFFNGFVKSGNIRMPNARNVYVSNTDASGSQVSGNAITLGNNTAFCVRSSACDVANPSAGTCPTTAQAGSAKLFVRQGTISETGGALLRLCNTTAYLMGGHSHGCVPDSNGTHPTTTPCNGTSAGTGQFSITGALDWTAPNSYGGVIPEDERSAAWASGEDLALWAESAATSSDKFTLGGGGSMNVAGVFFTPNARPFQLNGGAVQDLRNAQFIARTFQLGGGSNLRMTVDPNNAVVIPKLDDFTLVR